MRSVWLPWVNLHIQVDGCVTPCCESRQKLGDINREKIAEIWDGPEITTLRAQMLRGELVEGCRKCFEKEASGVKSLRQRFNQRAKHLGDRSGACAERMELHLLQEPEHYNIRILPKAWKARVRSTLGDLELWLADILAGTPDGDTALAFQQKQIGGIVSYMDAEDWPANLPKFRKITQRLDSLREEKTSEVFPELAPLLVEEELAPRRFRFAAFPFSLR